VQAQLESTFSQPPTRRRRWLRRLLMLPVLFVLVSVLQVLVLRFIDPPFSTQSCTARISDASNADGVGTVQFVSFAAASALAMTSTFTAASSRALKLDLAGRTTYPSRRNRRANGE